MIESVGDNSTFVEYNAINMLFDDAVTVYPKLKQMHSNCVEELETEYKYPAFRETKNMQVLLIFDDNSKAEPVGFALWFYAATCKMLFVGLIYVEPKYRQLGYANEMTQMLIMFGEREFKAEYIQACVVNTNLASIALHKKLYGDPAAFVFMKKLGG